MKTRADFRRLEDDDGNLPVTAVKCWFHIEQTTPSMLVDNNGYNCLGCGKKGSWPKAPVINLRPELD